MNIRELRHANVDKQRTLLTDVTPLRGSIPLNIHEVWPRPFWGEAYRWKKNPVDHFIGHIPLFYQKFTKAKSRVFKHFMPKAGEKCIEFFGHPL